MRKSGHEIRAEDRRADLRGCRGWRCTGPSHKLFNFFIRALNVDVPLIVGVASIVKFITVGARGGLKQQQPLLLLWIESVCYHLAIVVLREELLLDGVWVRDWRVLYHYVTLSRVCG